MVDPREARRRWAWRHLVSAVKLPIVGLGVNRISMDLNDEGNVQILKLRNIFSAQIFYYPPQYRTVYYLSVSADYIN